MLSLFGTSVFLFLFFGMLRLNAYRWRYLSEQYGAVGSRVLETRRMQSAVLLGLNGFNSLKGIVTIGRHDTGVSFRVMAPFSLFHSPLFIPYADIKGARTRWYIDGPSTELEFAHAPDVKMIMPEEQAEWLQQHAGGVEFLNTEDPPRAGSGWQAFILATASFQIIGLFVALAYYLATR